MPLTYPISQGIRVEDASTTQSYVGIFNGKTFRNKNT